jgi:hypothetical protein
MLPRACPGQPVAMRSTGYAAVWQDGGPAMAGRIALDESALTFDGRQASRRVALTSIASTRMGRGTADRVGGRPAIVIELRDGEIIRVATPELGALHELAEALSSGDEPQRDLPLVDDRAVLG